jgi:hypothetical protein
MITQTMVQPSSWIEGGISIKSRQRIRERASCLCEYCHLID